MSDEEYREALRTLIAAPGDEDAWRAFRAAVERAGPAEPPQSGAGDRTVAARARERRLDLADHELGRVGRRMADYYRLRFGPDPPKVSERLRDQPWINAQSFQYPGSEIQVLDLAIDGVVARRAPAGAADSEATRAATGKPRKDASVAKKEKPRSQDSRMFIARLAIIEAAKKLGDDGFPHPRSGALASLPKAAVDALGDLRVAYGEIDAAEARERMRNEPTRSLLDWLAGAHRTGGRGYAPWDGQEIPIEEIKAELAKREHVMNKKEGREARRKLAKLKARR